MRTLPDENKLSDSILDGQQRARLIREESVRVQAEQAEREKLQRDRQAAHEREARKIDDEVRAHLFMRVMRMREEAKPKADVPPVPLSTARQDETLEAEQAAGRRALEKYARRNDEAQGRISAEERGEEIPGFKISP